MKKVSFFLSQSMKDKRKEQAANLFDKHNSSLQLNTLCIFSDQKFSLKESSTGSVQRRCTHSEQKQLDLSTLEVWRLARL